MSTETARTAAADVVGSDPARRRGMVAALCFGGFLVAVLQTMVVPLLPAIGAELSLEPADTTWILTANLLAGAVGTPLLAKLGDMTGKRRMLVITMGLLIAGSVLAAATASFPLLLAGRVLQGASAAVIPLAMSIARDELPPRRARSAIAMISATLSVGAGAGLVTAGLLNQLTPDYQPVFWVGAGAGVLALVLVLAFVAESPIRAPGRLDAVGAVLLSVTLVCLLLGVSQGNRWGWSSPAVLGLLVGAAVAALAWTRWELRSAQPLVDLRLMSTPTVLRTNVAALLIGFALFGSFLAIATFLQTGRDGPVDPGYGFGFTVLATGLFLLPQTVISVVVAAGTARLAERVGYQRLLVGGCAINGAAYVSYALWHDRPWQLLIGSILLGVGVSLAYASIPALILAEVPPTQSGIATGVNAIMRTVGGALAGGALAALLSAAPVAGTSIPSSLSYSLSFSACAGACFLAIPVVLLRRRTPVAG